MKALFWMLAALVVAVGGVLAARYNNGLVLIVLPPWRVELSLTLAVLLLCLLFFVLHGATRLVQHMLALPRHAREFRESRRRQRAQKALEGSLVALVSHDLVLARTQVAAFAREGEMPEIAQLLSRLVEHQSGESQDIPEKCPTGMST